MKGEKLEDRGASPTKPRRAKGSVKSSMKECKEEVHHGGTKTRRRGSENLSKIGILSTFSERLRLEGEEKWGIGKSTQVVAMTLFPCPPEYKLLANMGCARIRGDHRFAKTLFSSFFSVSPCLRGKK